MRVPVCVAVLAHNEASRIATCLKSLPLGDAGFAIHVLINGSTDATAAIARQVAASAGNVTVHDYVEGGKARSWNRFLFDDLAAFHDVHLFVDGDAEVVAGSVQALVAELARNPAANAAAGLPMNGRKMAHYQQAMRADHGLFGDLYALRGDFLARMKALAIRLPEDLVGDDGLICAMAKTDLGDESQLQHARVVVCGDAGFLCAPVSLMSPSSWRMQYRRMISYSVRHFQNLIISEIMRANGPAALPRRLAQLYADQLPNMKPRPDARLWLFDRIALRLMVSAAATA
jgi:hypothetical protein